MLLSSTFPLVYDLAFDKEATVTDYWHCNKWRLVLCCRMSLDAKKQKDSLLTKLREFTLQLNEETF